MTVRLWEIPSLYPNKHMGVFRDPNPTGNDDLRFKEGRILKNEPEIVFEFKNSTLDKLRQLGCLWTSLSIPLVNETIAGVLAEYAPGDFQLIPTRSHIGSAVTTEFSFINITHLCDCLDSKVSKLNHFDTGEVSGVKHLRFKDDTCMEEYNLGRLGILKGYILVSETLYRALSKLKFKGLRFAFDRDGDDFR
ncbi:MAG: DUF1629 domain-containing protein [Aestuariivirga sp.]